ncbi:MAG TPA: sigma-54 dependent transcriptional regulator, partial [Acidobacteriota bacterium]|nr:sigma-54 dependent transcriptional regulator [Acidobacteriota bacterium]
VVMPEIDGLDLLRLLKEGDPTRPVILMTAHGSVDMAVEAMKEGAKDFVTKPLDYPKLRSVIEAVEEEIKLRKDSRKLVSKIKKGSGFGPFIGTSPAMKQVYSMIKDLANTDASVLITGESGTGKELAARSLHELSARADGPFIAINASAIPHDLMESEIFGHEKGAFTGAVRSREGCFELANGGTLFLDEIGEMPIALQPKLLRVLEDGRVRRLGGRQEFQVDVRVLSATNRSPKEAIADGRLREDLFYRLNVFNLDIPPLRQRVSDIPILVQHFVSEFNEKHGTQVEGARDETLDLLRSYNWPGNVRELRNVIERAVVLAKEEWLEPKHLPPYIRESDEDSSQKLILPVGISAAEAEKQLILKTLERTGNNKAEAARQLGLDVKTIRNKLKEYQKKS